jgi:pimeloyl-ACP methyl ester carboxylesterase
MHDGVEAAGGRPVATFVLVHGGGHGGWCYQQVARRLRGDGHHVHTPTLSGLAERSHLLSPTIDLDTHIRDITSLLFYEDLSDVVLVGHSYGGMVVTGVADAVPERVQRLVYLDAATPSNGQSLADVSPALMQYAASSMRVVDGVELALWPDDELAGLLGVTDPTLNAWVGPRLTPHPWPCFSQPLRLTQEPVLRALPTYHVVCTSTLATRDPALMEQARAAGRLWDIDTGHDLMLTAPDDVARALREVASQPLERQDDKG